LLPFGSHPIFWSFSHPLQVRPSFHGVPHSLRACRSASGQLEALFSVSWFFSCWPCIHSHPYLIFIFTSLLRLLLCPSTWFASHRVTCQKLFLFLLAPCFPMPFPWFRPVTRVRLNKSDTIAKPTAQNIHTQAIIPHFRHLLHFQHRTYGSRWQLLAGVNVHL